MNLKIKTKDKISLYVTIIIEFIKKNNMEYQKIIP